MPSKSVKPFVALHLIRTLSTPHPTNGVGHVIRYVIPVEATEIKTSAGTCLIFSAIFSFPLLAIPAVLLIQGTYWSSGYWQAHLILIMVVTWVFSFLYQEVRIQGNEISLITYRNFRFVTKKERIPDITSWSPSNPLRLYRGEKEVMRIMWATFGKSDQQILFDYFSAQGLTQINE